MGWAGPGTGVGARQQAGAQRAEGEHADTEVSVVVQDDVNGVLGSDEATFQQGEARLHEEDQCRAHANPDQVSRVSSKALAPSVAGATKSAVNRQRARAFLRPPTPRGRILPVLYTSLAPADSLPV